jgi:hypothetical protein
MRLTEQSSLTLDIDHAVFHLIVGPPRPDGTVHCHLLAEKAPGPAFIVILDLTGHPRLVEPVDDIDGDDEGVTTAVAAIDPATWRAALADGLRRRVAVWTSLEDELGGATAGVLRRTETIVAALECDDTQLRPALAALAPTWRGTVEELNAAARRIASR